MHNPTEASNDLNTTLRLKCILFRCALSFPSVVTVIGFLVSRILRDGLYLHGRCTRRRIHHSVTCDWSPNALRVRRGMVCHRNYCSKDAHPGKSTQPIHSDYFTSLPFPFRLRSVGSNPEMLKHNMGAQIIPSSGNRRRLRKELDWNIHNRTSKHPRSSVYMHGAKMRDGRGAPMDEAHSRLREGTGRPREHAFLGSKGTRTARLSCITPNTPPAYNNDYMSSPSAPITPCQGEASMREQMNLRVAVYGNASAASSQPASKCGQQLRRS